MRFLSLQTVHVSITSVHQWIHCILFFIKSISLNIPVYIHFLKIAVSINVLYNFFSFYVLLFWEYKSGINDNAPGRKIMILIIIYVSFFFQSFINRNLLWIIWAWKANCNWTQRTNVIWAYICTMKLFGFLPNLPPNKWSNKNATYWPVSIFQNILSIALEISFPGAHMSLHKIPWKILKI